MMTADDFEAGYAARSGVPVDFLHRHGRYAEACACGEPECEGWAMGHQHEDALMENESPGSGIRLYKTCEARGKK